MNKNLKNKVLASVVAISLFVTMGASGALGGFWRAIYPVITDITGLNPAQNQFGYGYGYGDYGWGYGYGYGYGYGSSYDLGYYASNPAVDSSIYTNPTVINSNSALANSIVVSNSGLNVTDTVQLSIGSYGIVTLPEGLRITGSTTLPSLDDSSNVATPTGTKRGSVKFGVSNANLKFSVPVKIDIPVSSVSSVQATVVHYGGTTNNALTTTPAACNTDGTQSGGNGTVTASVVNGYATIYTCSASDFIAYTSTSGGGGGGGGGGGIYVQPTTSTNSGSTSTGTTSTGSGTNNNNNGNGGVTLPTDVNVSVDDNGNTVITKGDGTTITFSDISNTFAKEYIAKLAAAGIISGYPDGTFRPEANASRAEYLKIVLRAMGVDYSDVDVSGLTFNDVSKDSWIAKVVVKASDLGLIDSSNAKFRPNDSVTRAEAMKMLLNSAGIETSEVSVSSFADVKVSGWESKYIETAKSLGIVDGQMINGKLMFRPFTNITRAEVSKIVVKTMVKE